MYDDLTILVRGAGELGSATAYSLHTTGFRILLSELPLPLAIRRTVTFSDAVFKGEAEVEGVKARLCNISSVREILSRREIPMLTDSAGEIPAYKTDILVDARMFKRNVEDMRDRALFTVGIGPGFHAGMNCHVVIETMRGHNLGKIFHEGAAKPDTGVPGHVGGEAKRRVLYASRGGTLEWRVDFGWIVEEGELLGLIDGSHEIRAPFRGMVRGLISPSVPMADGLKIADIDPRGESVDCRSISDKSRAVGRGVLEAVLAFLATR